ncbi:hypothetical protein NSMM_910002 [Nitrosomonas mobilis]|uniref:Uncharacterized protein n=1 Tax=Nitrosomonas mobilis TaxID=51642 RepID=A0A1G5SJ02_9PROT|nr:hypothetical protein NSMM_910002 [Nitrosomonas mobilis]
MRNTLKKFNNAPIFLFFATEPGILFLDFPGKHRVEQKLIQQPQILNTINAMRKKYGKPPFVFHDKTPT